MITVYQPEGREWVTESGAMKCSPMPMLTAGKRYLVLGLQFIESYDGLKGQTLLEVEDDAGRCLSAPLGVFRLEDGRVSRHWVASVSAGGSLLLWPEEMMVPFFHDDLSEGRPVAQALFRALKVRLAGEAAAMGQNPPRELPARPLPDDFVLAHGNLSWAAASLGYQRGWTSWTFLQQLAERELERRADAPQEATRLACLEPGEEAQAGPLSMALAHAFGQDGMEAASLKAWLVLALKRLLDDHSCTERAFDEAEGILREFDHQNSLFPLLRCQPEPGEPETVEHPLILNQAAALESWRQHLEVLET